MLKYIKKTLALLFIISLTACSYSPETLKILYANAASDYAKEIKEGVDPTAQQSAMIDDYTEQLLQWHRRNKLPEYSRNFAKFAELVKQDNISLKQLHLILQQLNDMPHFAQATHLTYKIAAVAELLTAQQIAKIEKELDNQWQRNKRESKKKSYQQDAVNDLREMFSFLNIQLTPNQRQLIKTKAKKLHNIDTYKLQAEKQWNKRLVSVLHQTNNPNFLARFKQVWDIDHVVLTGKAHQLEQQNNIMMDHLMKDLITSFSPQQKDRLSIQLQSISDTFGEMVYE